jgi:tight adherence protein B
VKRSLAAALTALAVVATIVAPASAAGKARLRIIDTQTSGRNVTVTVEAPISLAAQDLRDKFVVMQNGNRLEATARAVPDDDRQVVLLIDTSGSMAGEAMEAAKAAAAEFIRTLPPTVDVAVVGFGDEPYVASPFAAGPRAAARAVEQLEATGETALYDAVQLGLSQLSQSDRVTRTIVLLSDGADTVSLGSLADTRIALTDSKVGFLAIRLETSDAEAASLQSMADAANGHVFSAADPRALSSVYDEVAASLKNQYVLRFAAQGYGATAAEISLAGQSEVGAATATLELPASPPPAPSPVPVPPPAAAPAAPRPVALTWVHRVLAYGWLLPAAAVAFFLGAGVFLFFLLWPAKRRRRGAAPLASAPRPSNRTVTELGDWAKGRVDRTQRERNAALEQGGILLRPAEFVLVVGAAASVLFLLGTLIRGLIVGILLSFLAVLGGKLYIALKKRKRRAAFNGQLGDTLQMMAGSLRTGYGLLQAADAVAKEADAPSSEEFRRLVMETRLGRDINETLAAMADRVGSEDFHWVMQAIEIHREVGGDLAVILDEVGATIRERDQVFRQVKALSAEGRLSAIILLALPFVVVGGISITNPSYMDELFNTRTGNILIAIAGGLLLIGGIWVRKVVQPKF